jgi:hypothetical protein
MARHPAGDYGYKQFLQEHKEAYLERQKSTGGYKAEWLTELRRDLLASAATATKETMVDVTILAAEGEWERRTPPGKQLSLFSVAGFKIEESYTFRDKSVPGGFRRVLGQYAVPYHLFQDVEVKRIKLDQSARAVEHDAEVAAAVLIRCGGDQYAPIWDARDAAAA